MTEVEGVAALLTRRISATRLYGDVSFVDDRTETGSGYLHLTLGLTDADVMVFLEPGEGGTVRTALTFLLPKGKPGVSLHLNHWRRVEDAPVPALVESLWARFWQQEEENREADRVLWMHGPTLPTLNEDAPPRATLQKKQLLISEEDVLALFGSE